MNRNNGSKVKKKKQDSLTNSIVMQAVKRFFKENKIFKEKNVSHKFGIHIQDTDVVFFESQINYNLRDVKAFFINLVYELQTYSELNGNNFLELLIDNRKEIDKPLFQLQSMSFSTRSVDKKEKANGRIFLNMALSSLVNFPLNDTLDYLKQLAEKRLFELNMLNDEDRKLDFLLFGENLFTLDSRKPHEKKIMIFCMKLASGHHTLKTAIDAKELQELLGIGKISDYVTTGTKSLRIKYRKYLNLIIARNYSGTKYFIYPHIEVVVKK